MSTSPKPDGYCAVHDEVGCCADAIPNLRSCDFTSNGCSDSGCRYCYGGGRDAAGTLSNLSQCLAVAAGLCEAWRIGRHSVSFGVPYPVRANTWSPGCGRSVR